MVWPQSRHKTPLPTEPDSDSCCCSRPRGPPVCGTQIMRISSRSRTRASPCASRRVWYIPSEWRGSELAPRSSPEEKLLDHVCRHPRGSARDKDVRLVHTARTTMYMTHPYPRHEPHHGGQHVKASTVIGEKNVPSRLKSDRKVSGACVKVYTEEDSAWGDNDAAPKSPHEDLVSRPKSPTEESADLLGASLLSDSCGDPSAETAVPVLEPLLGCLMVSLTFETRSDCHRALVRRSHFCNDALAYLNSFPSHSCASVGLFRTQARKASLQRTTSQHPHGSCTPREAGVRHRMNLRCRKHEYAAPVQRKQFDPK